MPQIPVFTSRTMPELTPQRGVNVGAAGVVGQAAATGGARVADAFGELAAATAQAASASELIGARARHTEQLAELRVGLETDTSLNPADIRARWDAGRAKISADILGQMRDRAAQQQFRVAAAGVEAGELGGVVRLQATRTAEAGRANLSREIDGLSDAAAAARDPRDRGRILGQIEGSIATAVQNHFLAADDAEKLRQRSLGRLDNAAAIGLIRANPMQALAALADPARFSNLDPVQRERLANTATSAMGAAATAGLAAETRAARVQTLLADRAANDIYARIDLAEQGKGPMPTVADVQGQREWLKPGETSALLSRLRGANHRDQPSVRLDLERDVDRMDPVVFDARVRREVDGGRLTAETAAGMLRANRSARRDDGPPAPATAARTFVRESLDPGDAPMAQLAREQYTQRQLNAVADIERWSRENPSATAEQYDTQARSVVNRYRETSGAQLRLTLPKPFGFAGDRQRVDDAALTAAAQAVLRANLPPAEQARELEVLETWRTTFSPAAPTGTPRPAGSRGAGPSNARTP